MDPQTFPPLPPAPALKSRIPIIIATALPSLLVGLFLGKFVQFPKPPSSPAPVTTPFPTAGVPADWLSYSNSKYGFEFKYPPSYAYSETSGEGRISQTLINLADFQKIDESGSIRVNLDTNRFSIEYLKTYAPTGSEELAP